MRYLIIFIYFIRYIILFDNLAILCAIFIFGDGLVARKGYGLWHFHGCNAEGNLRFMVVIARLLLTLLWIFVQFILWILTILRFGKD
jgi:hypothetical protein